MFLSSGQRRDNGTERMMRAAHTEGVDDIKQIIQTQTHYGPVVLELSSIFNHV